MKRLIFLFLIFFSTLAIIKAQSNGYKVTFDHVALSVSDIDKSAKFYVDILNLEEITNRTEMNGIRWFSLGEGKELHLISLVKTPIQTNKAVHFALTVSDFDAFVTKLKAAKIPFSDWPGKAQKVNIRADGIKQVFFQDPNGYWIEVNSVGQKND